MVSTGSRALSTIEAAGVLFVLVPLVAAALVTPVE